MKTKPELGPRQERGKEAAPRDVRKFAERQPEPDGGVDWFTQAMKKR